LNTQPLHNEPELLRQFAEGVEQAFELFYKHYIYDLNQFLLRYIKSPQIAEDLSQEIFLKIWEKRLRMKEVDSFRAYLFITARNHALNALKTAGRSATVMGEILRSYDPKYSNAEDHVLNQQYLDFLHRTLASLPSRSREVFQLCRPEGRSYEEVAKLLGISKNSVKNHMVHSMKVLKAAVEKELGISFSLFLILFAHQSCSGTG
jgi:RNA polymerase sigma-70 factor (family 1)